MQRALQAFTAAGHAAFVPHELAEFAVKGIYRALAFDRDKFPGALAHRGLSFLESGVLRGYPACLLRRKVGGDGRGNDEVAIGESLHERTCAEAIRTVI